MSRLTVLVLASLALAAIPLAPATPEPGDEVPCPAETAPLALSASQPVASSVEAWSQCYFTFEPAPGEAFTRVTLTGIAGDVDLRLKRGSAPTFTDHDCRSWESGPADERCEVDNDGSLVHVMVNALGTSGAYTITATSLTVPYCDLQYGNTPIALNVPHAATMTTDRLSTCFFEVVGDGSTSEIVFSMDPESEPMDLYVREGRRPTPAVHDCFSTQVGVVVESCTLPNEAGARYHMLVVNNDDGGDFTVSAVAAEPCSLGPESVPLPLGAEATGAVAAIEYASCHFVVAADGANDALRFHLAHDAGVDVDLFVREGAPASYLDYDCSSANAAPANESCELPRVAGAVYHVTVTRWDGQGAFTVRAEGFDYPELSPGVTTSGTALPGESLYYKIAVPDGLTALAFVMTPEPGAEGNADLLVRDGAVPTNADNDCAPQEPDSLETCVFLAPEPGVRYMVVRGNAPDPAPFRLTAHLL